MKRVIPLILAILVLASCEKEDFQQYQLEQISEEMYCGHILPSEEVMKQLDEIAMDAAKAQNVYYVPYHIHVFYDGSMSHNRLTRPQVVRGAQMMRDAFRNTGDKFDPEGVDMLLEWIPQAVHYHDGYALWGNLFADHGIRSFWGTQGVPSTFLNQFRDVDPDAHHVFIVHKINPISVAGYASYWTGIGQYVLRDVFWTHGIAVHEGGHCGFLDHTFQNTPSCNYVETNCETQGDKVCDTPIQVQSWSCGSNCGHQLENYMGYNNNCLSRFTAGQRDRTHALMDFWRPQWQTEIPLFDFDQVPALIEPRRTGSSGYLTWHQWGADSVKVYVSPTPNGQDVTSFTWEFYSFSENSPAVNSNFQGTRYYGFRVLRNGTWSWYRDAWKVQQNGPIQRIQNFNFSNIQL